MCVRWEVQTDRRHGMAWHGMGRDGTGRDGTGQMGRDGMGWGRWDGMGRDRTGRGRWDGMGQMGWDGTGQDGMGQDGMGWDGMGWDGMGWDGTGRDGTGWEGMGWDGTRWDRMGRYEFSLFQHETDKSGKKETANPLRACMSPVCALTHVEVAANGAVLIHSHVDGLVKPALLSVTAQTAVRQLRRAQQPALEIYSAAIPSDQT